jgi:hypothetical protein
MTLRPATFAALFLLLVMLGMSAALLPAREQAAVRPGGPPVPDGHAAPTCHALLVGVTKYPHLDEGLWLSGGANDVLLVEELLRVKFSFPRDRIVILSEAEGSRNSRKAPSRTNIERECRRLARLAREGDRVVVFLAGHGSLQPEKAGARDPYPDGFDRIFLPRDVRAWQETRGAVNAISGRELGEWLRPIPVKKASLWVVVDACHSGEMLRGAGERVRQADPEQALKIPRQAMERARKKAARPAARAAGRPATFAPRLAQLPGVALLYACQAHEVTVEQRCLPGAGQGRFYGLLTCTLGRILSSTSVPLTYRELTLRIQNEYSVMDRTSPTPVIEGRGRDQIILGSEKLERLPITLSRRDDGLRINAGQMHGMTAGSVLAVYPPPGEKGTLRGHVRITRLRLTSALVVPCVHGKAGVAAEKDLLGGRCEVVLADFGDQKLRVAVDRTGSRAGRETGAARQQLQRELDRLARELQQLGKGDDSPIRFTADQRAADWLVRLVGGQAYLLRAAEWEDSRAQGGVPAAAAQKALRTIVGPAVGGEGRPAWLRNSLTRIARAQNLLKLTARPLDEAVPRSRLSPARAKVEMVRLDGRSDRDAQGPLPTFYAGESVEFRVTNTGRIPLDVTLLYVDSGFGIEALFPLAENNRLRPGATLKVPPVDVKVRTTGREHVVLIAVKAEGLEPVDFVSLAQPTIKEALTRERTRGKDTGRGLGSPLGRLLLKGLYGSGRAIRGLAPREREQYFLHLLPVQIAAGKRPGEAR